MIKHPYFIPDNQKLCDNLTSGDLFDRIINLKITCYDKNSGERESFVIRSDYELIFPSNQSNLVNPTVPVDGTIYPALNNKCIIRRCTNKPSIKVQCKMVSTDTGTSIDVFVTNFFILTEDGKHLRSFNESKYKMETVEIAMGYWGQFSTQPESVKDYFNIKAENGADKITLTGAIVVTTDKLPPDSVLHIKGYVGDIYSSPIDVSQIETPKEAFDNPVTSSDKDFKELCYNLITRRYLNMHYFTDKEGKSLKVNRRNVTLSKLKSFPVAISYDEKTGMMSTTDADNYGVQVYLSKKAQELSLPKMKDADGNEVTKSVYFEAGYTVGQTITRIIAIMQVDLNYTFTSKGDILIYTSDEVMDFKKLHESFQEANLYKDTVFANKGFYDSKLPAVNNITIDTVATIVCPFFTFFEPFQYVEFASRFALTSAVGYFASYSPTIYRFLVINATINFATVDDVNEVHITAVSSLEALKN